MMTWNAAILIVVVIMATNPCFAAVNNPPVKRIFGSLELNNVQDNINVENYSGDLEWLQNRTSFSFYLDELGATNGSLMFSYHRVSVSASRIADSCYIRVNSRQYELSGCTRQYIILDVYADKYLDVYNNLNILESSDVQVAEENADEAPSRGLHIHKTSVPVRVSHVNMDPLTHLDEREVNRRVSRKVLGNLIMGRYVNHSVVPYNAAYSAGPDTPSSIAIHRKTRLDRERVRNISLVEGVFLQERVSDTANTNTRYFRYKDTAGKKQTANYLWLADGYLYSDSVFCLHENVAVESGDKDLINLQIQKKAAFQACIAYFDCCGLQLDPEQPIGTTLTLKCSSFINSSNSNVYTKGRCSSDNGKEIHFTKKERVETSQVFIDLSVLNNDLVYMSVGSPLVPVPSPTFVKTSGSECAWTRSSSDANSRTLLFTFNTKQNGFKLHQNPGNIITYQTTDSNITQARYFISTVRVSNDIKSVELKDMKDDKDDCKIYEFSTEYCLPIYKEDNKGYRFFNRTPFNTSFTASCIHGNQETGEWKCKAGQFEMMSSNKCQFRQCYFPGKRTLSSEYVSVPRTLTEAISLGSQDSGECCGGRWSFKCEENYTVNYTACSQLKPCADELFTFNKTFHNDIELTFTSRVDSPMKPGEKREISCGYSREKMLVSCDGCSGKLGIKSDNSCTPPLCSQTLSQITEDYLSGYGKVSFDNPESRLFYEAVGSCPHGGTVTVSCRDNVVSVDKSACSLQPRCPSHTIHLHKLKGAVTVPEAASGAVVAVPCPSNPDSEVKVTCLESGVWDTPQHSQCEFMKCDAGVFKERGVIFENGKTEINSSTVVTCDDVMCNTCGRRTCLVDGDRIGYTTPDFTTCKFNCTLDGSVVVHGNYSAVANCTTAITSKPGKYFYMCRNGKMERVGDCVSLACSYENRNSCYEIDAEAVKSWNKSVIADSYLNIINSQSFDLTSPENQRAVTTVVDLITEDTSAQFDKNETEKVTKLIDAISQKLAPLNSDLQTRTVHMFGFRHRENEDINEHEFMKRNQLRIVGSAGGSVSIASYNQSNLFLPRDSDVIISDGNVKSIVIKDATLSNDFTINMSFSKGGRSQQPVSEESFQCRYYDLETGSWDNKGCKVVGVDDENIHCSCNHLTSFAVLVSLNDIGGTSSQSVATKIFLYISIFCLLMTLLMVLPIRKFRSREIVKIHMNLAFSMLLGCTFFLCLDTAAVTDTLCVITTAFVHYFWLAVFGWMLVEGITMYRQTVMAIKSYGKKIDNYVLKCGFFIYGGTLLFPALGVILHYTTDIRYIRSGSSCFLSIPYVIILLFLAPMYTVLIALIYLCCHVTCIIISAKSNVSNKSYWKRQLRAVVSIATLTGMAWIIAPFMLFSKDPNSTYTTVVSWIFSAVLGLQGLTMFIVQVMLNEEVRSSWSSRYSTTSLGKLTYSLSYRLGKRKSSATRTLPDDKLSTLKQYSELETADMQQELCKQKDVKLLLPTIPSHHSTERLSTVSTRSLPSVPGRLHPPETAVHSLLPSKTIDVEIVAEEEVSI